MARTERAAPLDQAELSAQFFPKQLEVANRLFARIQEVVDLGKFTSFEFVVMVPNLLSLYSQTLERLEKAFPTPAGKVRQSIFRANESPDQKTVFEQFRERVLNVDNQKTLFLFLQDEAHWAATAPVSRMRSQGQAAQEQATGTEATGTEESGGAAGNYLNDADMCAAPNLIQLLVTATPYNLVTRKSRIPEDNVIQWFSESDSNIPANAEHSVYYGIQKFRNYLQDGQDMQQGKFHSRQATEQLLHANPVDSQLYHTWRRGRRDGAESARENGDLYRRHFNHSQIYAQSIRAAAAAASEPPPSGQHRCPDTDQMIKELVSCQNGNDGRSFMILIRVGLVDVGRKLKAELIKARNEAQLQEKFAVLLDVEGKANFLGQLLESGPLDPNYWLTKLRRWNDNDSFVPSTYSDLKGLPCLLILCEKGKMGDTFPSSLRYYDLRLRYSDSRSFVRASLEQDLGRACRYVAERVTDPIPVILIPPKLHRQLKLEEGSNADPFVTLPSADNRVEQLNGFRQHAEQHQALTELLSLSAYRLHCDPADSHYDKGNRSTVRNRFLLYGRPQVGKTGAYLALLRRFEEQLQDDQDVMDCAEDLTDAAEAIDEQPEAKEESIAEATEHPEPMAVDAVEDVEVVQVQPMPPAIAPQSNRGAYPELAVLMGQVGQPGANQLVAPAASTTSTNPQNQVQNGDTAVNVAAASNAFVPNYVARPFDHASTCNDCRMGNLVAGEDLKIPGSSWDDLELHLPTGVDAFAPCTLDPLLQQLRFKPTSSNCKMLLQEFCATLDVKFPIFVDSFQRAHLATLNWRHAMVKDVTDPASIATYLQIVVICREDLGAYRKAWPHLILAVLPEATVPATQNLGFTRYCIQRFAQRCGFEFVWMMDDLLHSFKYRALARETLLQAASRLVLASDAQASEPQPESAQQIHAILQQLFKDNRDRMEAATITAIPAYFALRHLELHPNKDKVAISGFSRPTPRSRARRMQDGFSRQHVYGAVLLNIRLVDESNVWYPKHEAAQADEEFNARCTNSDLLIVMYHRFSFHTKELRSREPVQSQSLPSEHAVTQPHLNQHSGSDAAVQMDVDPPATPSTPIGKMSGTSTSVPTTPNGKAFGNDSAPYTPVKGLVSTTGKRPALDVSTVPDTSKKRRPDSPAIELPTAAESTDSTSLSFLQSLVAKFTRTHGKPAEAATKLVESTNGGHQPVEHETSEPINGDETVTVGDKTIGLTGRQGDRATPEPLPFDEASFVQNLVANLKAREVASAETKSQKEAKAQHRVLPERQVSNGPSSPSSVSNPRSHVLNDLPRPQLVVASPSSSSFRKGAMAETAAEKSTGFARRASSDTEREMVQGPTKRRLDEPDIRPVKRSLLELSDSAMASEASTPVVDATQSFPILATCVLPAGAANIQVQLCDQRFSSIGFKGNEMLMQYSLATLPATPNATSTPTRCEVILDPETMAVKIVLKRS
ncbi:hypothetical protein CAOG_009446 [Capsaspora owczarzaki ATCC 30864]|uniref:Uncharacterized protein n=3 Tax=Capsaspora owczarzaki (strain ATCC 30864) TaxID=595528 RepID=A0A0D2WKQ9_CAPO3|nr:hypothetical protein CAOG_009446 [Capsaspora owczarzaki ATCC 30864]